MKGHTSRDFPAIRLVLRGREKYRLVRTVWDATELLVTSWPTDDGEEYMIAVRACLDAFHDVVPAVAVRDALIRAANEEHIAHISLVS